MEVGKDKSFATVNAIFKEHWSSFYSRYESEIRDIEVKEVNKMLSCKEAERGYSVYYCRKCDKYHFCYFGCNSRICSCCGKRHADNWSDNLAKNTFDVPHTHFTMTLPDFLWQPLMEDRSALKVLMDSTIETIKEFYEKIFGKEMIPGCIVVLHPFGRDLMYKPHIHVIATKGGFSRKGEFHEWTQFIPYKILHKKWMYIVCKNLQKHLPNTEDFKQLFRMIWAIHGKEGFVVDVSKREIKSSKQIARYLARYVRHPAIANKRIVSFNDDGVHFFYTSYKSNSRVDVRMSIDEFLLAIIQHIPESQFKMIRYYGAYSRNQKKKYKKYHKSSIRQTKVFEFVKKREVLCPRCQEPMEFIWYCNGNDPPKDQTLLDFMQ